MLVAKPIRNVSHPVTDPCPQLGPAAGGYLLSTVLTGKVYERTLRRHGDKLFCIGETGAGERALLGMAWCETRAHVCREPPGMQRMRSRIYRTCPSRQRVTTRPPARPTRLGLRGKAPPCLRPFFSNTGSDCYFDTWMVLGGLNLVSLLGCRELHALSLRTYRRIARSG